MKSDLSIFSDCTFQKVSKKYPEQAPYVILGQFLSILCCKFSREELKNEK